METLIYRQHLLDQLSQLQGKCTGSRNISVEYPGYAKPTTPFRPYNDYYVNLEENFYEDDSDSISEADDSVLGKFVNTLLTNQALALAGSKEYHEEFDGKSAFGKEKIPDICKVRPNFDSNMCNDRLPRKKTRQIRQSRSRRSKFEADKFETMFSDLPTGGELNTVEGTLMINLPLDMLRQYLYSEVEARVWNVNAYYKNEWEIINKERLTTLAELVHVQETSRKLKMELDDMMKMLKKYKEICDNLGTKVETSKEAKRRRRQAKKQRKTAGSISEGGAGDGGQYPRE